MVYIKKAGAADFVKLDEPYLNQYPVAATYNPARGERDKLTYRTFDPNKPLDQQPFYQFTKSEIDLGRFRARELYDNRALKYTGTPYIGVVDKYKQPWNRSELQNNVGILDEFEIELGKDEYWLMGDNRLASHDSRAWGPVNKQLIHGKIKFRIWSLDSDQSWWILELIKHPINFWHKVRWSRCLQVVR